MKASSDLGLMMPEVHLFHSEKKFRRYVTKNMGGADFYDSMGQMTYYDGVAVVKITYAGEATEEAALLVHEAYHAAVAHMRYLGEDEPGEEVMAYLVQSISFALLDAHNKWKSKKG